MNKKFAILIVVIVLAVSSLACSFGGFNININSDFIKGSGNISTETRTLNNFDAVALSSIGDLTIKNSDKNELVIEADDNLLPYITSEIKNSKLIIGMKNGININPTSKIRYTLYMSGTLTALDVSGLGNISAGEVNTKRIDLVVSGSGNIVVDQIVADKANTTISGLGSVEIKQGQITNQSINISGSGHLKAENVESNQVDVTISGLGGASLWVTDQLNAQISGSGSIDYYGNPRIQQNVSGLGKLNSKGNR